MAVPYLRLHSLNRVLFAATLLKYTEQETKQGPTPSFGTVGFRRFRKLVRDNQFTGAKPRSSGIPVRYTLHRYVQYFERGIHNAQKPETNQFSDVIRTGRHCQVST